MPKQKPNSNSIKAFRKVRFAIVAQAKADPDRPALVPTTNPLPAMPTWYAKYRASPLWRQTEFAYRQHHAPVCDQCRRYTRTKLFHSNPQSILPHDPATITQLCATCEATRIPAKPAQINVKSLHSSTSRRQALKLPPLRL